MTTISRLHREVSPGSAHSSNPLTTPVRRSGPACLTRRVGGRILRVGALLALSALWLALPMAAEPAEQDYASELKALLTERIVTTILAQYSGATRENISVDMTLPSTMQALAPCATEPDVDASRDQWLGSVRLSVRCHGSPGWALNVRATSSLTLPVAALDSSLPRNHVLTENDITFRETDIAGLRQGFYLDADSVVGAALVRNLSSNQILTHRNVEVPPMIHRGDQVTILVRGGGMMISMEGTAMADGVHGRQISVRNNSSDRVIRAWVVDRGVVEVPFVARNP